MKHAHLGEGLHAKVAIYLFKFPSTDGQAEREREKWFDLPDAYLALSGVVTRTGLCKRETT